MTEPYREPGRDVDVTDIERTKVQEQAATQRKLIEEREKTKREAIGQRDTAGHIIPRVAVGLVIVTAVITAGIVSHSYFEDRKPVHMPPVPACVDETWTIDSTHGGTCKHPQQSGQLHNMSGQVVFVCTCSGGSPVGKELSKDGGP